MVSVTSLLLFCSSIALFRCENLTEYATKILETPGNITEETVVTEASNAITPENIPNSLLDELMNEVTSSENFSSDDGLGLRSRKVKQQRKGSLKKRPGKRPNNRGTNSPPVNVRPKQRKTTTEQSQDSATEMTTMYSQKHIKNVTKKQHTQNNSKVESKHERQNLTVTENNSSENQTKPTEVEHKTNETESLTPSKNQLFEGYVESNADKTPASEKEISSLLPISPTLTFPPDSDLPENYVNAPYLVQYVIYPSHHHYGQSPVMLPQDYYGHNTAYPTYPGYSDWDSYNCCIE
uniref:Uncharacterized protein n=1 Tax=Graphocephala atropunctata TaxID=36148 RepID=A0A1B6LBW8_9HEMI